MYKTAAVREAAERAYRELGEAGLEVLFDDRDERPGVMFADLDLIGIPHRIVIGERGLAKGSAEYKSRRERQTSDVDLADLGSALRRRIST